MKRIGYLADKVFTRDNVRAAWDAYNRNRPLYLRREYNPRVAAEILDAARRDFRGVLSQIEDGCRGILRTLQTEK